MRHLGFLFLALTTAACTNIIATGGGDTTAGAGGDTTAGTGGDDTASSGSGGGAPQPSSACGDTGGLQPGAAWPMVGGCPTRRAASPYVGAQTSHVKWGVDLSYTAIWVAHLTIDAAGTVYVPTGTGVHAIQPDGTTKWTAAFTAFHPPVIGADGTLYAPSYGDYLLHALSPADGSVLWSSPSMGGMYSEPALRGDGAILGVFGDELRAISASGQGVWAANEGNGTGINGSPAVAADGTAYLALWAPSGGATLVAVDAAGQTKWTRTLGTLGATQGTVIGPDGTIYVGEGTRLHAITPDGDEAWALDVGLDASIFEWLAFGPDGTLYVVDGYDQPGIHALEVTPTGATVKWSFSTGGNYGSAPVVGADGTVYVGLGDVLYALRPDGTQLWAYTEGPCGTPAIAADGTTYAACQGGLRAFGP